MVYLDIVSWKSLIRGSCPRNFFHTNFSDILCAENRPTEMRIDLYIHGLAILQLSELGACIE